MSHAKKKLGYSSMEILVVDIGILDPYNGSLNCQHDSAVLSPMYPKQARFLFVAHMPIGSS